MYTQCGESLCIHVYVHMHLKSVCFYVHTDVVAMPLCTMLSVYIPRNHCYCSPLHACLVFVSGIWLNKFIADFQVTNPSNERLAVTDITGHYMDEGVP